MYDTKYWRVEQVIPFQRLDDDAKFDTEIQARILAREMAAANPGQFFAVLESTALAHVPAPKTPTMEIIA